MNNSFRYSLGKIIAICPQCGRRCFKPYVDNSTGRPLDVRFCGRCNRENSCQYHLPPPNGFATTAFLIMGWRRPRRPPPGQRDENMILRRLRAILKGRGDENMILRRGRRGRRGRRHPMMNVTDP